MQGQLRSMSLHELRSDELETGGEMLRVVVVVVIILIMKLMLMMCTVVFK
ncbi:hypothetical protein [Neoaquamicrobium sediminum]